MFRLLLCYINASFFRHPFFSLSSFHGFGQPSPSKKSKPVNLPLFARDPDEVYKRKYTLLQPSKMLVFDFAEDHESAQESCDQ